MGILGRKQQIPYWWIITPWSVLNIYLAAVASLQNLDLATIDLIPSFPSSDLNPEVVG
jgi:hypothetical protein